MTLRSRVRLFLFFLLLFLSISAGTRVMSMQDITPSSILELSSAVNGSSVYQVITTPARFQEGFHTVLTVEALNEIANTTITVNVTDPTGASYEKTLSITINGTGFGSNSTHYWSDFPEGANTNHVGLYSISLNGTVESGSFTVELTDKPEYRRTETVFIQAAGYEPRENVTISLECNDFSVPGFPQSQTANDTGIVTHTWAIPSNATPGNYQVTVLSAASNQTAKAVSDVTTFTVLGAICSVQTENLSNETVANVLVEVYNATTNDSLNIHGVTNSSGSTQFNLEQGKYTFKAFVKNVEVGNLSNVSVTVDHAFLLQLRLINLLASVETEDGIGVPFIEITLKYNYTTRDNETISEIVSRRTTLPGVAEAQNLFTNLTYRVEARHYDALFNCTTLTVSFLPASPSVNLRFELPTYWLNVYALDSNNQNAGQIQICVYEWSSGVTSPLQELETDNSGVVSFFLPFGKYRLRAYKDNAFLRETAVNVIADQSTYDFYLNTANLRITVLIFDDFGQPIANAEVKIERKINQKYVFVTSQPTGPSGSVLFDLPAGGDSLISVYIAGRLVAAREQFLSNDSSQVTFKLGEYVTIIGYPLPTSLFAVFLFILILAIFVLVIMNKQLTRIFAKELRKLTRKSLLQALFVNFMQCKRQPI